MRTSWTWVLCVSVGAAALWLGVCPPAWPNPLGDGDVPAAYAVPRLASAAQAFDAACARGDRRGFEQATTAAFRRDLDRRLSAVEATLDDAMLPRLAEQAPHARWFERPMLAAHAKGTMAAIAVRREQGAELMTFFWDGHAFRIDGTRHLPSVVDAASARAAVVAATANDRR